MSAFTPVIAVVAAGALLATLLGPLADRVQYAVRSRSLAAVAVILVVLAPFVVLAGVVLTVVVHQAQGVLQNLPTQLARTATFLAHIQTYVELQFHVHVNLSSGLPPTQSDGHGHLVTSLPSGIAQSIANLSGGVLRDSIGLLSGLVHVTIEAVLALVVAFFLIWDGKALMRSTLDVLPRPLQPTANELSRILSRVVSAYFRGQVVVGAVFGLMIGLSMLLLGVPDAALLGFLAGLFEMIPTVGPFLASVGPVLMSLTLPHPHLIWLLVVLVVAQQVESNLLVPRISGGVVGLHPLTVILGVFAGWSAAGLVGALLAVPALAVAREAIRRWWRPPATPAAPTSLPGMRPRPPAWPRVVRIPRKGRRT